MKVACYNWRSNLPTGLCANTRPGHDAAQAEAKADSDSAFRRCWVPLKRTLCQIPVLCCLDPRLNIEALGGTGLHYGDRLQLGALWIRRWPA
ncbi:MAG: hypothetical protein WB392_04195 [Methanotrichaceae archaeon]